MAAPFLASAQETTWFAPSSKWGYYLTDGTWEGAARQSVESVTEAEEGLLEVTLRIDYALGGAFPTDTYTQTVFEKEGAVYWPYQDTMLTLYDFDLQVGDAYYLPLLDDDACGSLQRFVIDSTGTLEIDGQILRFQHVSSEGGPTLVEGSFVLTERIGNLSGSFFYPETLYCTPQTVYLGLQLQCYQGEGLSYSAPTPLLDDCEQLVPTSQLDTEATLTVFPNPVKDWLQVATTGPEVEWMVLFAADGTPYIRTQATRINLSALPSGLYVLKAGVPGGSPLVQKVLKL
jgi:hypothetical protein